MSDATDVGRSLLAGRQTPSKQSGGRLQAHAGAATYRTSAVELARRRACRRSVVALASR